MPTYSLEINTDLGDREAGLQDALARYNASLPEGDTPLDEKQYLQRQADRLVDNYAAQFVATAAQQINSKFARADQATRDLVTTALASVEVVAAEVAAVKEKNEQ